jgi:hypothetical protein
MREPVSQMTRDYLLKKKLCLVNKNSFGFGFSRLKCNFKQNHGKYIVFGGCIFFKNKNKKLRFAIIEKSVFSNHKQLSIFKNA